LDSRPRIRCEALPLQAAAAAGEPPAQEVHSLLERQGQAAPDELIELPITFRGERFESAVSYGGLSRVSVASRSPHR
jgi:hypothetical protein